MNTRSAFVRGGCWALAIGLPILAIPMVVGWLKPGPTDPRVYSNLLLMLVFSIPIFVFGGFIAMFRSLSRQAQSVAGTGKAAGSEATTEDPDWAHQRTHQSAVDVSSNTPVASSTDP